MMSRVLAFLAAFLIGPAFAGSIPKINQISVSCGTSSTSLLPNNAASHFIMVEAPTTGGVWIAWNNTAAVTAPPSEHLVAGAVKVWDSVVPVPASFCISDGASAVTVTVEYW